MCSGVGAPVVVDGSVRGGLMVGSIVAQPLPPETEDRVGDFADLLATAIYNAENRAARKASRVEAVSGRLEIVSPAGAGTTLQVTIPHNG
jgi:hypothetical protein